MRSASELVLDNLSAALFRLRLDHGKRLFCERDLPIELQDLERLLRVISSSRYSRSRVIRAVSNWAAPRTNQPAFRRDAAAA